MARRKKKWECDVILEADELDEILRAIRYEEISPEPDAAALLDIAQRAIAAYEGQVELLQENIKAAVEAALEEADVDSLKDEVKLLKDEAAGLRDDLARVQDDADKLYNENDRMRREIEELKAAAARAVTP